MRSVLKSELKKNWLPFLVANIIGLLILEFLVWSSSKMYAETVTLLSGGVVSCLIIFYLICSFSYTKKRNELDFYYSISITKKELFLGKYLFVIFEIIASIIVLTIFSFIFECLSSMGFNSEMVQWEIRKPDLVIYINLLQIIISIAAFNWLLFVYHKANTIIDGLFYLFFIIALPYMMFESFKHFFSFNFYIRNYYRGYQLLIPILETAYLITYPKDIMNIILYSLFVAISFAFLAIMIIKSKDKYAEKYGKTDNDVFGYRLFIPIMAITIAINLCSGNQLSFNIPVVLFVAILQYVGFMIKNRKFIIPKAEIINIACTTGVSLIIAIAYGIANI